MAVGGGTTTDGLKQKLSNKKFVEFVLKYLYLVNGGPMRHDKLKWFRMY